MAASTIVFLRKSAPHSEPTTCVENVIQGVPESDNEFRGRTGFPAAMKARNAHFPSGLAAIRSQRFVRR